jgi:hypothetical protein
VERGGRPSHVTDRDIPRQQRVERTAELRRRQPAAVGEGDDLPRGVYPGIRTTGPVDPPDHPVIEACQRVLQDPLDRPATRIDLETGEVRAVIFDPCSVSHRRALSGAVVGALPAPPGVGVSAPSFTHVRVRSLGKLDAAFG